MSYLFGRLHNQGALILQPCRFASPLTFPSRDLWDDKLMASALCDLVDQEQFYTRVILAVPSTACRARAWTKTLKRAGFTRLGTEEVATLIQGYRSVIGPAYHPEHADLWGYGCLQERVHCTQLRVDGDRVFLEAVVHRPYVTQ